MDERMTFGQAHAELAKLLEGKRTWSLRVEAWEDGRVAWNAYCAGGIGSSAPPHIYANTPELVLERVRAALAEVAPSAPMGPADVAAIGVAP